MVVTSSHWLSAHLAGLWLMKRHPTVSWIARFSDPWMDNPRSLLIGSVRSINQQLENAVFGKADVLFFTSEETREVISKRMPSETSAKMRVIPHCFDPVLYPRDRAAPSAAATYVIRHLGHFYGQRSPVPLFKAIEKLSREEPGLFTGVSVEIVGSLGHYGESLHRFPAAVRVVRLPPTVDYGRSLEMMTKASCLLVIDAPIETSIFLPSKLIDYFGGGRFVFTPDGTVSRILRGLGGQVAHLERTDEITDALRDVLRRRMRALPLIARRVRHRPGPGAVLGALRRSTLIGARDLTPRSRTSASQMIPRSVAAPVTEHSRRRSMASRSKRAVNWLSGSAQGSPICLTPWVGQATLGMAASIQVVNWQVSRWRQPRGFRSYPGTSS